MTLYLIQAGGTAHGTEGGENIMEVLRYGSGEAESQKISHMTTGGHRMPIVIPTA